MDEAFFRDMPVDPAPLRLRRSQPAGAGVVEPETARARAELAYREAVSAGFTEGMRQGREEGRVEGHAEGVRSGRDEAQRHARAEVERAVAGATAGLQEERSRLKDVVRALEQLFGEAASLAEDDIVALCYEAICRIVAQEGLHPESVRAAFAQAVAAAREEPQVLLHVHPADAALLERLGLPGVAGQSVTWCSDPSVALGGCILKSASGGLDLRLDTLLAGCKAALLRAREVRLEQAEQAAGERR